MDLPFASLVGAKDPLTYAAKMALRFQNELRSLLSRVAQRTGVSSVTVRDADPKRAGDQTATISVVPQPSDGPADLLARFCCSVVAGGTGAAFVDEASRLAFGQPRGLDQDLDRDELLRIAPRSLAGGLDGPTFLLFIVPALVVVAGPILGGVLALSAIAEVGIETFHNNIAKHQADQAATSPIGPAAGAKSAGVSSAVAAAQKHAADVAAKNAQPIRATTAPTPDQTAASTSQPTKLSPTVIVLGLVAIAGVAFLFLHKPEA